MIIATIRKLDGTYLDHGNFASEEAAMIWFQPKIDQGIYGQKHVPAQYQTVTVVIQEAVLDEQGQEISPAVLEEQQELVSDEIPAAFVIEFQEIADPPIIDLEQQQINNAARAYLYSTDWYVVRFIETGIAVPSEITAQRAAARASVND
jgi:hypothetical protein